MSELDEFLKGRERDRHKPKRRRVGCRGVVVPGLKKIGAQALSVRQQLIERDGSKCFFCFGEMRHGDVTIEHLLALSLGGKNHVDNLALAHGVCNSKAGNLPVLDKLWIRENNRQVPCVK